MFPGMRSVCIREVQKSLKESAKRLVEDKIEKFGLTEAMGFKVLRENIETPGGGQIIFQGMQDHTADSIKSLEGFGTAWVEEAQTLSERSLELLRPTIRDEGSEIWFSWNPHRASDPVDKLLRGPNEPTGSIVVRCNWNQNPWFPSVLAAERQDCEVNEPDKYGHIWEGEYARVLKGAYYANLLEQAEREDRIGNVGKDPILPIYAFWDIGGTSAKSDATAIWIAQMVGEEPRVLNYYEAVGQPMAEHIGWLHSAGYQNAIMILPHDGVKHDIVHQITPRGMLSQAGFQCEVVPNQGHGAALKRIDAVRRLLPRIRFERDTTEAGREALGWYHERWDEKRNTGLGPEHDWASHGADAFGLLAEWYLGRREGHPNRDGPGDGWGGPMRGIRGVA